MKRFLQFSVFILFVFSAYSNDSVLIKIDGKEITTSEFERIYKKNNNSSTIDNKTTEEYLELYINFKLKVIEAENLGYDTLKSFVKEFETYRKQLVKPYFIDKEAEDNLVKEAYERMKQEVNVSHIMIRLKSNASPEDTLQAYNKIMEINNRLAKGEDFDSLAGALSEDDYTKKNKGNLGYFSVFDMVYPFESAAYKTPTGSVSAPFKTSYGYHIVKVIDKRPNQGKIKVAHIMKMIPKNSDQSFKDSMKIEIFKIYDQLKKNGDFADLAKKYSDDKSSSKNGGELPWFASSDRIIEEFKDKAFSLKKNGEMTEPFETQYGWHIIRRVDKTEIEPFDKLKTDLLEKIKKDPIRNMLSEDNVIIKLKKEYSFNENNAILTEFIKSNEAVIFTTGWDPESVKDDVLFSFADKKYTVKDFAKSLNTKDQSKKRNTPENFIRNEYSQYIKKSVLDYEESMLDEKYPEYKNLVQEYHDGILLFNLTDEMVWTKAVRDTAGLKKFYEDNKSDYNWKERADAKIYSSNNKTDMALLSKKLKTFVLSDEEILKTYCDSINPNCISIENSKFQKGDNNLVDLTKWKPGTSKVLTKDDKYYVVKINSILPVQQKEFEEAIGLITSDYQNYLDKEWIKELRGKYKIEVDKQLLSTIK